MVVHPCSQILWSILQNNKISYVSHLKLKMPADIEFVFALPLKGDIQSQVSQPKLEDLATL